MAANKKKKEEEVVLDIDDMPLENGYDPDIDGPMSSPIPPPPSQNTNVLPPSLPSSTSPSLLDSIKGLSDGLNSKMAEVDRALLGPEIKNNIDSAVRAANNVAPTFGMKNAEEVKANNELQIEKNKLANERLELDKDYKDGAFSAYPGKYEELSAELDAKLSKLTQSQSQVKDKVNKNYLNERAKRWGLTGNETPPEGVKLATVDGGGEPPKEEKGSKKPTRSSGGGGSGGGGSPAFGSLGNVVGAQQQLRQYLMGRTQTVETPFEQWSPEDQQKFNNNKALLDAGKLTQQTFDRLNQPIANKYKRKETSGGYFDVNQKLLSDQMKLSEDELTAIAQQTGENNENIKNAYNAMLRNAQVRFDQQRKKLDEIEKMSVDPNRFFKSRQNTGQQVLSVVASIMGAQNGDYSAGIKYLERAIGNDIQMQKDDISNKYSIYNHLKDLGLQEHEMDDVAAAYTIDMAKRYVDHIGSLYNIPKAQLESKKAMLNNGLDKVNAELKLSKDEYGLMHRGSGSGAAKNKLQADVQKLNGKLTDAKYFEKRNLALASERMIGLMKKAEAAGIDLPRYFKDGVLNRQLNSPAEQKLLTEANLLSEQLTTAITGAAATEDQQKSFKQATSTIPGLEGLRNWGQSNAMNIKRGAIIGFDPETIAAHQQSENEYLPPSEEESSGPQPSKPAVGR